jgi:sugar phosphate isomerase/epimerase
MKALWQPTAAATISSQINRRDFLKAAALVGAGSLAQPFTAWASNDGGYQLGCYTRPWSQFEYHVALDGIASAGYQYAGLMSAKGKSSTVITVDCTPEEVAAIAAEVKQRGLKTLSIYGGHFPVEKSMEAGIAGLKKLIDHSALCGCPHLMLGGTGNEKVFQDYYKVVAECCDYAAAKSVGLSVKPHGGKNANGAECRKIIELVGHKNFRIWYDPGNIFFYSQGKLDPVDDAPTVNGWVSGVSIKDFKPPKEVMVTPGTGQVNFKEVMHRLKQGGFSGGPLVVECLDKADTAEQITAEAKKARLFLENLVKKI